MRRFPATTGVTAVILVLYGLEAAFGGTTDMTAQVRLGGLRGSLVFEHGEWYRLFTATFLHHGPIHLVFNLLALGQIGVAVEHCYGSVRMLGAYLVCGLAGALASAFFLGPGVALSLGASGAILGLAGVLLGAIVSKSPVLPPPLRRAWGWRLALAVGFTFAVGLGASLLLPIVDNASHAGGFVAGLVLGVAVRVPLRTTAAWKWGTVVVCGAYLAAMAAMTSDGQQAADRLDQDLLTILPQRMGEPPEGLIDAMVMADLMRSYDRLGEEAAGVEVLEGMVAKVEDPDTVMYLVIALFEEELEAPTEVAAVRWVALAPDDAVALNALAWHYASREGGAGDVLEHALELSGRALAGVDRAEPEQEPLLAAFLDTLGELKYQQGAIDEALSAQNEAVYIADRLDLPEEQELRVRLAKIKRADRARRGLGAPPVP